MLKNDGCFIALHIGAGFHSPAKAHQYKRLCRRACNHGIRLLRNGKNSTEVVQSVCSFLEDSPLTNAGYGSNLSIKGSVECDAGIMESSTGSFGAVTCLKGVKNPIKLAKILLDEQLLSSKLMPPILLAGDGAREKAAICDLELVTNDELTSPQALNDHTRYKRLLEDAESHSPKKAKLEDKSAEHCNSKYLSYSDESFCKSTSSDNENISFCENEEASNNKEVDISGNTFQHLLAQTFVRTNKQKELLQTDDVVGKQTFNNVSSDNPTLNCNSNNKQTVENNHRLGNPTDVMLANEEHSCKTKVDTDNTNEMLTEDSNHIRASHLQDTIGVICVDNCLNIASGVSSGGIVLKQCGRVGHAAHYGSGCWAFDYSKDFSIASCTSGIMTHFFTIILLHGPDLHTLVQCIYTFYPKQIAILDYITSIAWQVYKKGQKSLIMEKQKKQQAIPNLLCYTMDQCSLDIIILSIQKK